MPKFSKVFIRDLELRAPGLKSASDLLKCGADFSQDFLNDHSPGRKAELQTGEALVSPDSPFYPRRADLKTMRAETIYAVDASGELLSRCPLSDSERESTSLYASTSLSHGQTRPDIDDILLHLSASLEMSRSDRNALLMRKLHPLFGLKALTNAAESFVAQHTQIRGENATFGDTAQAGYEALLAAAWDLEEGRAPFALSVGTNCGAYYTALALESYTSQSSVLRESSGAVALLLSSTQESTSWKLSELSSSLPESSYDFVISSSSYTKDSLQKLQKDYSTIAPFVASYESWGSLGAASFHFSLARALSLPQARRVLLVEEDVYGVRSFGVLERVC